MLRNRLPSASSLFVFEAAARTRNFSRAAEELGITQPAVSRTIAALEAHLGQQLFARSGPRLDLTECGQQLSRVTFAALRSIENVIVDWDHRDPSRESVLLSISSAMATHWLIPRLGSFRAAFPDVDLRFELIPGGVGGPLNRCDLGLRVVQRGVGDPVEGFYSREWIQAVGAPAYLREHGTLEHPKPGKTHTLIALTDHWCTWNEYASRLGITLPDGYQVLTFADYSVVLQTAVSGQGLALGWVTVTSKLLLDRVLMAASDAYLDTGKDYYLVSSEARAATQTIRRVRDWTIDEIRRDIALLEQSRGNGDAGGAYLALPPMP